MIETILSFDVSSTTTGYAVISLNTENKQIEFTSVNYIKPIKEGSILERLAYTRDLIKDIIEKINPTHIAIEDILLFVPGRSTANTITVLASFNRMIGLLSLDYLGRNPSMYSALAIRQAIKSGDELPSKSDMPELVAWHLNIKFPYVYNKKQKIKDESEDMADAIAVGLMKAFELGGKTSPIGDPPKLLPKKKKAKKIKKKKKIKRANKNESKNSLSKTSNSRRNAKRRGKKSF